MCMELMLTLPSLLCNDLCIQFSALPLGSRISGWKNGGRMYKEQTFASTLRLLRNGKTKILAVCLERSPRQKQCM